MWILSVVLGILTATLCYYTIVIAGQIKELERFPGASDGVFSALITAIFGILITGVFVFMTFRIDRGAVREARLTAEREANKILGRVAKKLQNAETKAKEAADTAIADGKKKILLDAEDSATRIAHMISENMQQESETRARTLMQEAAASHETFVVNVANKLRADTIAAVAPLKPDHQVLIPLITREDGQ